MNTNSNIKVSVIVPIYNVGLFLNKCIESIAGQSYDNLEIILVNDESKDNSLEICRSWEKKDDRILVIDQKNQGVSVARNAGIAKSTGDWICFVDGDDWLEDNCIIKMLELVEDNTDVLITDYFVDTASSCWHESFFTLPDHDFTEAEKVELIKNCFLKTSFSNKKAVTAVGVPWAKLFKASFIRDKGITFDKKLRKMQDAIFNIEVYQQCDGIIFRNIPTYHYRQNNESVCHKPNPNYRKISANVIEAFNSFINKYNYQKVLIPVCEARRFMFAFESIKFIYILDNTNMSIHKKLAGVRAMFRNLRFDSKDIKNMKQYLGKAHRIALALYRIKAYSLMYFMSYVYFKIKTRRMK